MADTPQDVTAAPAAPVEPQEPTAPAPSTEENKAPEVAKDEVLEALKSEDDSPSENKPNSPKSETDKPKEPTKEDKEPSEVETPDEDKPLDEAPDAPKSEKSVNRFQTLANENKALKEQIEQINSQVYQAQTVEELMQEGESEAMAEVKALRQEREIERFNGQVAEAQTVLDQESRQILQEFPMFDPMPDETGKPTNPKFQPEIASQAAELFDANLIRDPNTGQIIGYHASPYQIYKPIADAYSRSNVEGQIAGQKANSKMLASVDPLSSASPAKPKEDPLLAVLASDDY